MSLWTRNKTVPVIVGGVTIGGGAPVVVQSMTNTDTADAAGTAAQVAELTRAGSELVRVTVNNEAAAVIQKRGGLLAQVPARISSLLKKPLVNGKATSASAPHIYAIEVIRIGFHTPPILRMSCCS